MSTKKNTLTKTDKYEVLERNQKWLPVSTKLLPPLSIGVMNVSERAFKLDRLATETTLVAYSPFVTMFAVIVLKVSDMF